MVLEITTSMLIQRDARPGTPALSALRRKLSAVKLHVVARRPLVWARPSRCYWNVKDCVAQSGGRIRFGWMVIEISALTLVAWHHAVWQQPDGRWLDITPHPQSAWGEGTTAFLEDPSQDYDLSWPPAQVQQFQPLVSDPRLDAFISAYESQFALQRAYLEHQRAVPGVMLDEETMRLQAQDPMSAAALRDLERAWMPKISAADSQRRLSLDGLLACQTEHLRQAA